MNLQRLAPWLWSLVAVAGLGVLAGVGISYAQTLSAHPVTLAGSAALGAPGHATLSRINHQYGRFFHIRGRYQRLRVGEPAIRVEIPALHVDSPVIPTSINASTQQWQTADWAVGYLVGSANPGACTSFNGRRDCSTDLAAHDDIKGELFKDIGALPRGADVLVYTKHSVFTYSVSGQQAVAPTEGSILNSPVKELLLVTCRPYWVDTQRLVVSALLRSARPRHGGIPRDF
jgi:LPXTG-site transpeptidase (sortase) family protein